ncbi:hypothetical protein [Microbacterium sp.]|uniref:hypothetical protein n=1 Tax=Microbacterium sp. TaxID=51671 RepID=UPI0035674DA4
MSATPFSLMGPIDSLIRAGGLSGAEFAGTTQQMLEQFSVDQSLSDLCDFILSDDQFLESIATRSIRHPMGFDKIVLGQGADGTLVKLDVWWEQDADWGTIHNHRFDFSSLVLAGELQTRLYFPSAKGEEYRFHSISIPSADRDEEWHASRLALGWLESMPVNGRYTIDSGTFHTASSPLGTITATLVAQSAPRRSFSLASDGQPLEPLKRISADELSARLRRLKALGARELMSN